MGSGGLMITLIKDATTTGISQGTSIIDGNDTGQDIHSFQVITNGSPTELIVSVLGTINGSEYDCIASHTLNATELVNGSTIFHLVNKPIPKIKIRIDKLEGGVSPQVSVHYFKGSVST